jgi:hypothetical protein
MRPQHDNNANLTQPQSSSVQNHPPQSAVVDSCSIPLSDSITGSAIAGFAANVEAAVSSASPLPDCQLQTVVNHECQLVIFQQSLRGLVLQMRFRYDRISRLLRQPQNNSYNDQRQVIQHALRDSVCEMHCIVDRSHVSQLQFQHIRTLSLHTNIDIRDRLFELQQLSALHACHSLCSIQPRLERINSLLLELLSQLQQANAHAAAQAPHARQANPQQAVMLSALLPGPGNVVPFQAQVEEDNPSLTQIRVRTNMWV